MSSIKRGASQVPDQLAANCLAAFVEAVEEMRCEPYFGEDEPCKITEQAGAVTYTFGDRFHFRSALVTFRRVWLNDEASALPYICGLLERYEGGNLMVEIVRGQYKQATNGIHGNIGLSSKQLVDLWLNAVFAHTNLRQKKPSWHSRVDFDRLVRAHGHGTLEFFCRSTVHAIGCACFNLLPVARAALGRWKKDCGLEPEFQIGAPFGRAYVETTAEGHVVLRAPATDYISQETGQQRFERILARRRFQPLAAILRCLAIDPGELRACVESSGGYAQLIATLGYALEIRSDLSYSVQPADFGEHGNLRASLPWHDVDTRTTHVTLVRKDRRVVSTKPAVEFFDNMLKILQVTLVAPC